MSFVDPLETVSVSAPTRADAIGNTLLNHPDEGLGEFLSRPIFIHTNTWTPGQGAAETATLDPWTLFLGNKRVINRLNNFRNFRGDLKVRIMMNGNGFYYGRLLIDYVPLATIRSVGGLDPTVTQNNMLASQRMHVYIDPSQSTTTEMTLPFFWYYDAIDIPTAEWSALGRLYIRQLAGLKHANGGSAPITYTIAAWVENLQLGTPTVVNSVSVIAQAKVSQEPIGPVQKAASAIGRVATALKTVPVIGPWATAASVAMGAVSSIAKIFGWSRPNDLTATVSMKPIYNAPFAPTDAEDYSQKLTVDSKNELSVDPAICGYDNGDELTVASFTERETYITTFPWTAAAANSTLLWNSYVTPNLAATDATYYYIPSMLFAALPFHKWRGCMKFRFQVVASAYHRGRLLITWDPLKVSSIEPNVQISRVVDITEEKDFTLCVGWGNPKHYLDVGAISTTNYGTAALSTISDLYNGVLSISVLNELATPSASVADISVLVFASMDDAEFADPESEIQLYDQYHVTPQAMVSEGDGLKPNPQPDGSDMDIQCHPVKDDPNSALVYYGEHIPSLRPLLHRYCLNTSVLYNQALATNTESWRMYQNDFPVYYGYDVVGNALSLTSGGKHVNFSHNHLINYLAPAFAAVRGSIRSKYITRTSPGALVDMEVQRGFSDTGFNYSPVQQFAMTSPMNIVTFARAARTQRSGGASGTAYVNTAKQPLLETELPFYRPVRFACGYAMDSTQPYSTNSSSHGVEVTTTGTTLPVVIDRWVAGGEDLNFIWFQGCPPLAALATPAA